MKNGKSQFRTGIVRSLTSEEQLVLSKVESVISGSSKEEVVARIPGFVSGDDKDRDLIFSTEIAQKISEHGDMLKENFIINANDWDYVICNATGKTDKINLIKEFPNGGFIRIGANKRNGYFIVTHYENIVGRSQKLKNLLEKGDALDRFGRTPLLT